MNVDSATLVHRLSDGHVLCIGDVMLDRYIYGSVERISPEAPVPVCHVRDEASMLGGAGNVVRNLAALGVSVDFFGVIGDDEAGELVRRLLAELDTVSAHLVIDDSRPTTIKERIVAGPQQLLRVDRESDYPIAPAIGEKVFEAAMAVIDDAGAVVISDYGKGVLTRDRLTTLTEAARRARRCIVVDPKGNDFTRYRGADVITPNRRELAEASRMPTADDASVIAAARSLIEHCGISNVLATLSGDGMSLISATDARHFPAEAREVYDVSGAGDTVVAALAGGLASGIALADAARLANVAAGIVVAKAGTAVVYPVEIEGGTTADVSGRRKFMDRDAALAKIADWRRKGEKVGFANGCFDLIHPGHVALLSKARAACDRLVVALNSDESVRRLKGEGRPVQNEHARAAVMSAFDSVDLIVLFDEDTPLSLIKDAKPDILIKGTDYAREDVVGGDLVEAHGGRVMLVELEEGHSTTGTIRRMTGDPVDA